jgi:hypothetical protein
MNETASYRIAVGGVAAALFVFLIMAGVILSEGGTVPTEYWTAGSAVGGGLLGILVPTPKNALSTTQQHAAAAHEAAARAQVQVAQQAAVSAETAPDAATKAAAAVAASTAAAAAADHGASAASLTSYIPALALLILFVVSTVVWLWGGVKELQAFSAASGTALIGLLAPAPTS